MVIAYITQTAYVKKSKRRQLDLSRIAGPVQQRLARSGGGTLDRRFTVLLQLRDVPLNRTPASDLAGHHLRSDGRSNFGNTTGTSRAGPRDELQSALVLLVSNVLHPIDDPAVERFLNGDMRHRARWGGAVPMLLVRRKPDDVARPDFLNSSALVLRPADTRGDKQRLTKWMRMPGSASTRFKRHA
jgi:hypothetical protein